MKLSLIHIDVDCGYLGQQELTVWYLRNSNQEVEVHKVHIAGSKDDIAKVIEPRNLDEIAQAVEDQLERQAEGDRFGW